MILSMFMYAHNINIELICSELSLQNNVLKIKGS